jgi:hypothetical protein
MLKVKEGLIMMLAMIGDLPLLLKVQDGRWPDAGYDCRLVIYL